MARTAIILGASGLVGSHLLKLILEEGSYDQVIVYARKKIELEHPGLEVRQRDLLQEDVFNDAVGDDLFCCIGTTQAKTPDLSEYRQIDYGIPVNAARKALELGMKKCIVISSMGASSESKTFYLRTKGQMEDALMKMNIPELYILRPSLLLGERKEFRFGERIFAFIMRFFKWLIPARYRAVNAEDVAKAMLTLRDQGYDKVLVESDEIRTLSRKS